MLLANIRETIPKAYSGGTRIRRWIAAHPDQPQTLDIDRRRHMHVVAREPHVHRDTFSRIGCGRASCQGTGWYFFLKLFKYEADGIVAGYRRALSRVQSQTQPGIHVELSFFPRWDVAQCALNLDVGSRRWNYRERRPADRSVVSRLRCTDRDARSVDDAHSSVDRSRCLTQFHRRTYVRIRCMHRDTWRVSTQAHTHVFEFVLPSNRISWILRVHVGHVIRDESSCAIRRLLDARLDQRLGGCTAQKHRWLFEKFLLPTYVMGWNSSLKYRILRSENLCSKEPGPPILYRQICLSSNGSY